MSCSRCGTILVALLCIVPLNDCPFSSASDNRAKPHPGERQPGEKQAPHWTPERMLEVKRIGSVQVSSNGKRIVFTVRRPVLTANPSKFVTDIFAANVDGSDLVQLTPGESTGDHPQWSPDDRTIAYLSSHNGARNIWLIPSRGGEARPLTHSKNEITSLKWSSDGKSIAFTALQEPAEEERATRAADDAHVADRSSKLSRLYVISTSKGSVARLLSRGAYSVGSETSADRRGGYDWSPDSKTIVFCHTHSSQPDDWQSADLSVVEVSSAIVKPLVRTKAAEFSPLFAPDGQSVAYLASDDPPTWAGDATVHVISAHGGSPRRLAESKDHFGRYSQLVGWSADGKRLFYTEADGTVVRLFALPLHGVPEKVSNAEGAFSGGVSLNRSRTLFGFGWESLTSPPEAASSPVDHFSFKIASRINTELAKVPLPKTEAIRWKACDGLEIEGLLTYPLGYEKGKSYPTLLYLHGGPMDVFVQTFPATASHYPLAAFAARGYVVLRPNPRGSSGYGKKFRYANYGDWGGGDFQDVMAGVTHLIEKGIADPNRLGVMGWSYGGYLTAWTITQTKRFKAASVGAGLTNLVSFSGTTDIPSLLPDYFRGEFWDKSDAYLSRSSIFHVKGVTTPTLIQHGEHDPRVPLGQAQEFHNALKRQGCTTMLVTYPRTRHAIGEPKLLLDCMNRNLQWFDRYLAPKKEARKGNY